MRNVVVFVVTALSIVVAGSHAAEIKTVTAVQARDANYYDYADYIAGPDGKLVPQGPVEMFKGCSWYCGGYVKKVSATAQLPDTKDVTFAAGNAHDFNRDTAWVVENGFHDMGESLVYEFNFDKEKGYDGRMGVTTIVLANGYKKSKELWRDYSRVQQVRLYVDEVPYLDMNLLDSFEVQTVDIGKIMFLPYKTTTLRFEIRKTYPGSRYTATAISEMVFEGVGVH